MAGKLSVSESPIPGLYVIDLELHGDNRGWFKESYQREKMESLGLPHFEVVQNNFSFNAEKGVIRGLHAEPWEKYISLASGRVFGAWVDLRKGDNFGKVFTQEITQDKAIFVPRGVANSYQTLEENVAYTYLVNEHWQPSVKYTSLSVFDESLGINWPIGKDEAILSEKDSSLLLLKDVEPLEI